MKDRMTGDKMLLENWLPMLSNTAREDWLKTKNRDPPLWPEFEQFLQLEAKASRERERLGLTASKQMRYVKQSARDKTA